MVKIFQVSSAFRSLTKHNPGLGWESNRSDLRLAAAFPKDRHYTHVRNPGKEAIRKILPILSLMAVDFNAFALGEV